MAINTELRNQKADKNITEKRLEIAEKKDQMEDIRRQFIMAGKEFILDYIRQEVERAVSMNVENTRELHEKQQLSVLKSELAQAIEQACSAIEVELNQPQYWIHLMTLPKRFASDPSIGFDLQQKSEKDIEEVFRRMLGYAGALLLKYHYVSNNDTSWEVQTGGIPRYRYGVSLTEKVKQFQREYQQYSREYCRLQETVIGTQIASEQAEARALWENA